MVRLREHCYRSNRRTKDMFYDAINKYGRWDSKNKTIENFTIDFYVRDSPHRVGFP